MKRYFCADHHFNNGDINRFCRRPVLRKTDLDVHGNWTSKTAVIESAERGAEFLINNCNNRVKPEDNVICVGDLQNYGDVKGVPGLRRKPAYYFEKLNGIWIVLEGNHDTNNKVKPVARYMILDIGPYRAFVSHYPVENEGKFDKTLLQYIGKCTDFQICGHVHKAWKHKWHKIMGMKPYLMYNVGVDVQKYMPVSDQDIIRDVSRIMRVEGEKQK